MVFRGLLYFMYSSRPVLFNGLLVFINAVFLKASGVQGPIYLSSSLSTLQDHDCVWSSAHGLASGDIGI